MGLIQNKQQAALFIAILFHAVGVTGILFFDKQLFAALTPFHLLLSFVLILWTHADRNIYFWLFAMLSFVIGFFAEYSGVNYQLLFGDYQYLPALGTTWEGVPYIIGVNWFIIIYCCGVSVQHVLNTIWNRLKDEDMPRRKDVGFWAIVLDGALLATFFDWVMEPVAVKLGFWQWLGNGSIPFKNYWSWFLVSALLLLIFRLFPFQKNNLFGLHLLLIQLMFFLILRTFL
ncbi:MAG: carotenoid biosynthesis protein [Chitinophagaceae bacterium]|jgi:bisanhydrobacterioruberin hydratase|nr:carotenoid biosynthesis protein [Chitinophagaceae bacterium]